MHGIAIKPALLSKLVETYCSCALLSTLAVSGHYVRFTKVARTRPAPRDVAERCRRRLRGRRAAPRRQRIGAMRPAVIMMMVYRKHLDRLAANRWRPLPPRTGLARARANIEKLWIAIHYGLF